MAYDKPLPKWTAKGVEPPENLKEEGWKAGIKPPADYFNWLQNKTFEALEELQDKSETKDGSQAKADTAEQNAKNYADDAIEQAIGDIDLSDVATKEELTTGLAGKVDKIAGKGLSSNDYTTADKNKLAGIEAGAEKNKVTSVAGKTGAVTLAKGDVGLSNLDNVKQASKAEFDTHANNKANPHGVTKAQVGLGNLDNVKQASKSEFDAHLADQVHQAEVHGLRVNAKKELEYFDGEEWKPSHYKWTPPDDTSGSPGSDRLIAGTMQAGFFGEVSASELMNGTQLASAVGLSSGTAQHSNEPYLKFAYEGKIQFVAKKTYRYGLSWDQINSAGVVFGKNVTIGGLTYKVRLMRGAENDPSNNTDADRDAIGSEWNKLMLPIHVNAPNNWAYPDYGGMSEDWGIDYTDADLLTLNTHGSGSFSWCQETRGDNTNFRVLRGRNGVSNLGSSSSSAYTSGYLAWRPVLELIE